jgi:hypothetical protein
LKTSGATGHLPSPSEPPDVIPYLLEGGRMRRVFRILSLWAMSLLVGVASVFGQGKPVPGQPELKIGDQAPDFTLQASDGKTYTLSQMRGSYVVLAWFPKAFTAG